MDLLETLNGYVRKKVKTMIQVFIQISQKTNRKLNLIEKNKQGNDKYDRKA